MKLYYTIVLTLSLTFAFNNSYSQSSKSPDTTSQSSAKAAFAYHKMITGQTIHQIAEYYYRKKSQAGKIYYYDKLRESRKIEINRFKQVTTELYTYKHWLPGTLIKIPDPDYLNTRDDSPIPGFAGTNLTINDRDLIRLMESAPARILRYIEFVERPYPIVFRGRVIDNLSKKPVVKALVQLMDTNSKLIYRQFTQPNGEYKFPEVILKKNYMIQVISRSHCTAYRIINTLNASDAINFRLQPAKYEKIKLGETKTITDSTHNAMITVPAAIVKRIDGRPVKYPIYVKFGYIDAKTSLEQMPGIDMLAEDKVTGEIKPLFSRGAVLIEAIDSQRVELRIDREKEQQLNKTTVLRLKVQKDTDKTKLSSSLNGWILDQREGGVTWQKANQKVKYNKSNPRKNILAQLPKNYLRHYAKDVSARVNNYYVSNSSHKGSSPRGIGFGEFKGEIAGIDEYRVSPSVTEEDLLTFLSAHILNDIRIYRKAFDTGINSNISDTDLSLSEELERPIYSKIFDCRYRDQWQLANTYKLMDRKVIVPSSLNPDFDYKPFLKIENKLYKIIEARKWKGMAEIRSVDLLPFNVDIPTRAMPIVFKIKEKEGDGHFEVTVKIDNRLGYFKVSKMLSSQKGYARFKILVPQNTIVSLSVKSDYSMDRAAFTKSYRIGSSKSIYMWGSGEKRNIVDSKGKAVLWKLLDEISI